MVKLATIRPSPNPRWCPAVEAGSS
uniref:Uncharacterized protein n=1 Tax=Anguilla anguilla TaxID=7936 RepID=A0A0E9RYT4_ANGAN